MAEEQNEDGVDGLTPPSNDDLVSEPGKREAKPGADESERLGAALKEVEDWRGKAYRSAADLDNFRKRAIRERDEARKFAIESVLKDLIPVADNLERALAHANGGGGALADGVSMIRKQFLSALERNGAKPFEPNGEPFDPQFHEAMQQVPRTDVEPGTCIEVFQKGWMLHERLVRPAMVVISSAVETADEPKQDESEHTG